jgi:hypothetical protein
MMARRQAGSRRTVFPSFDDLNSRFIYDLFLSRHCNKDNPFTLDEWESFYGSAVEEGLAPFTYLKLRESAFFPQHLLLDARQRYEDALVYKDFAVCCLREMGDKLCKNGRVVVCKGLALCETIYREPLIRPMGDVDLYFPDGAIDEVRNALIDEGFLQFESYRNVVRRGELVLDLHEDLWAARRVELRKAVVPEIEESFMPSTLVPGFFVPGPGLLAAHTAFHCMKHVFSRKIWCLDLMMIYKEGYINDGMVSNNAVVLFALRHLYNEGLIENVPAFDKTLSRVKSRLVQTVLRSKKKTGLGEIVLALCCSSWRETFMYLASSLVPKKHILKEMYGDLPYWKLLVRRFFKLISYMFGRSA